jgi:probable O-glycosylation ligase (exosortase A-associated)
MRDMLLLLVVAVCTALALRRPFVGLVTFVWLGLLNPASMTWTMARSARLSLVVGIVTVIGFLLSREPKRLPLRREVFLLLALLPVFALSTALALEPARAEIEFSQVAKIFIVVLVATALVNTEQRLRLFLYTVALSIGFHAVKAGIFTLATGGQYLVLGPERSFLYANNAIGLAFAMNIPLLHHLAAQEARPWLRHLLRLMLVLSYPAILGTFSRGAWLSGAAATAVLILRSRYRVRVAVAVVAVAMLAAPFLSHRILQRYDSLANYDADASAQSRFWNWEFCKRVGLAHPVAGGGFDFYAPKHYAVYYPDFSLRYGAEKVWSCHSAPLTVLAEHGVPGFLLWAALLISTFARCRQIRRQGSAQPAPARWRGFSTALEAAFVAFLVGGLFLDVAYFDMLYYLIAALVAGVEAVAVPRPLHPSPPQAKDPTPSARRARCVERGTPRECSLA